MTWVKLDDQFPDHPKTEEAGPFAAWLFVCSLCYCAEYLTDGFVPATKAARLANIPTPAKHISKLVDVGLWEPVEGGYRVHDYHDYQPTAEKVKAERKAAAERMNRRRTGSPKAPNGEECSAVSSPEQPPNEERSSTVPFPSPNQNPPVGPPSTEPDAGQTDAGEQARPPPKRARQFPDGWQPTEGHGIIAAERSLSLVAEAEQFEDFHRSKGSKFVDWDRAFNTWLRNSDRFASPARTLRVVNGSESSDPPRPRDVPADAVYFNGSWMY